MPLLFEAAFLGFHLEKAMLSHVFVYLGWYSSPYWVVYQVT